MQPKRPLIVNFAMDKNSPVVAWQEKVAHEMAGQCEQVVVFTDKLGDYTPRDNMVVHEFRKKKRIAFLLANWDVLKAVRQYKLNCVFIHMAHTWAYKLAPVFKFFRLPVVMWYAHGSVPKSLKWADACITYAVTSTPSGYQLPSKKLNIIGQGIDTDLFKPPVFSPQRNRIIYIGRISHRKNIALLIDIVAALKQDPQYDSIVFDLYGPCLTPEDDTYKKQMLAKIEHLGLQKSITIHSPVAMDVIPALHQDVFLHLSASQTDSMDKTLLESLACGVPVLTRNIAFEEMLQLWPNFMFSDVESPESIARRVVKIHDHMNDYPAEQLRAIIVGHHDQKNYVRKILNLLDATLSARS
jgi:glycosyltransferase involved in cell wall biosynthesis